MTKNVDLKGLRDFANETDREESPIFVGREREIEHVLRQAELVGKAHAEGKETQGATIIITGCPGSGKSTFLGHFARTVGKHELARTRLIPVVCSHYDLTPGNSKELQTQLAELAVKKERKLHQAPTNDADKHPVVCLLVDEIQTVTEASAAAIRMLHTQSFSPPVLPIYAGLDNSIDRVQRIGRISRLSANGHMTMGALRKGCATEATERLFEKYRVRSDTSSRALGRRPSRRRRSISPSTCTSRCRPPATCCWRPAAPHGTNTPQR